MVARLTMQMFDCKRKSRLGRAQIGMWLLMNYMDNARVFLPHFQPGCLDDRSKMNVDLVKNDCAERDIHQDDRVNSNDVMITNIPEMTLRGWHTGLWSIRR